MGVFYCNFLAIKLRILMIEFIDYFNEVISLAHENFLLLVKLFHNYIKVQFNSSLFL